MQLVLVSQEKLIENALEVDRELVTEIVNSMAPWHRDKALVLLLQAASGQAPVN